MEEVIPPPVRAVSKKLTPEERLQRDLSTIIALHELLNGLRLDTDTDQDLISRIEYIGSLMERISWKEDDKECIRNKHGYRDRSKSGQNHVNKEGAKCDFETLARLKDVAKDPKQAHLLIQNRDFLSQSVEILKRKVHYLLAYYFDDLCDLQKVVVSPIRAQSREVSQNDDVGFLRVIAGYYHDQQCLQRLVLLLNDFSSKNYAGFDLTDKVSRYQLGYFFTQFGEISKEVSDFIKPEHNTKTAENNVTRFLFGKLGKLRQIIKDYPRVVFGNNPRSLQNMLIRFQMSVKDLQVFVDSLMQHIRIKCADVQSIQDHYATINSLADKMECSAFEAQHSKILQFLTIVFDAPDEDSQAQLTSCQERLDKENEFVAKLESEMRDIQAEIDGLTDDGDPNRDKKDLDSEDEPVKKLFVSVLESKTALKVAGPCGRVDPDLLQDELSPEENLLCSTIRALKPLTENRAAASQNIQHRNLVKALKAHIKPHQVIVDNAIGRYNSTRKDPNETIAEKDYAKLIPIYRNLHKDKGADLRELRGKVESHKRKLASHQQDADKLKEKVQSLEEFHREFENILMSKPTPKVNDKKPSDDTQKPRSKLKKHDQKIYDIIKNTEFIQFVFTQLQKTPKGSLEYDALIMAEKMCFGIIGQLYKQITDDGVEAFHRNIIDTSILSDDCFQSILIRHKQVSHNVHLCDMGVVQAAVERRVIPWLKDFQFMLNLSLHEGGAEFDQVSESTPVDARLVEDFQSYDEPNKALFLRYSKIVALNRFLRSEDALAEYQAIGEIRQKISAELLTELHWQASLSYRNLNRFAECVGVLEKVIENAKRISDEPLRLYKTHGAYCDIAIAYTELDQFAKAREFLMRVTTGGESRVEHQIVGANVLLGGIEILEGNDIVGQALLELTFMKYFDKQFDFNKTHALSLLCHLASLYLDHFHLESARDCLSFAERILKDHFHEFIPRSGQQAIYFRLMILPVLARYKMLEMLCQATETSDRELEDLQKQLLEADQQESSMTYFSAKKNVRPLAATVLLGVPCRQATEILAPYLDGDFPTDSEVLIDKIIGWVMEIKEEVLRFYLVTESEPNQQSERYRKAQNEHQAILKRLTTHIVRTYEILALISYQNGKFPEAKKFMGYAILFHGVTDYIESLLTEKLLTKLQKLLSKLQDIPSVINRYTGWICEKIEANDLRLFMSQKLSGQVRVQGYVMPMPTIIQMYEDSKNDDELRDQYIKQAELSLMGAYYLENGTITMNIKFDDKRNLGIFRFWDKTEDGSLVIREQGYSYGQQAAATTPQPSQPSRPAATAPATSAGPSRTFSSNTDSLFKGMFGSKAKAPIKTVAKVTSATPPETATSVPPSQKLSSGTEKLFRGIFAGDDKSSRKAKSTSELIDPKEKRVDTSDFVDEVSLASINQSSRRSTSTNSRMPIKYDGSDNEALDDDEADAAIDEYIL